MSDQIQKTTLITVYSAGVAACYVAAYWSRFDVNIFQFAGLSGFASLALYPLMTALGINLGVAFFLTSRSNRQLSSTASKQLLSSALAGRVVTLWRTLGPAVSIAVYYLMAGPFKWLFVLAGVVPYVHQLAELPVSKPIAKDERRRRDIVYWTFAFPFLAGAAGGINAQTILDGQETRVVVPIGAAKGLQADQTHPIAFLGFAGGTYFLYESKTRNVVMVNQAVAEPLIFQPRPPESPRVEFPSWLHAVFRH